MHAETLVKESIICLEGYALVSLESACAHTICKTLKWFFDLKKAFYVGLLNYFFIDSCLQYRMVKYDVALDMIAILSCSKHHYQL